jgi:hypothetical protein
MKQASRWKYACASVTGTSHLVEDRPCQDANQCDVIQIPGGSDVLIAAVSDGAGSAVRAEVGSSLACSTFLQKAKHYFAQGHQPIDLSEAFVRDWLTEAREAIFAEARKEKLDPSDFACTFVAGVIGEQEALFLHIGDGAIVVSRRDGTRDFHCISWPQQGEYVNSTHFVTDPDAAEKIVLCYEAGVDEAAFFSDGIQHLVLEYEHQMAHRPFFDSVFLWLRAAQESDPQTLSDSLRVFLNSSKVNDRTDDDKTLILASRR